jgi:hypothetical protein
MLGPVHQPAEFLEPGPQLIGDVPPDLVRRLAVRLDEGLSDDRREPRFLDPTLHHASLSIDQLQFDEAQEKADMSDLARCRALAPTARWCVCRDLHHHDSLHLGRIRPLQPRILCGEREYEKRARQCAAEDLGASLWGSGSKPAPGARTAFQGDDHIHIEPRGTTQRASGLLQYPPDERPAWIGAISSRSRCHPARSKNHRDLHGLAILFEPRRARSRGSWRDFDRHSRRATTHTNLVKSHRMSGRRAHLFAAAWHSRRRPLGPHKVAREPPAGRQTVKSLHTRSLR